MSIDIIGVNEFGWSSLCVVCRVPARWLQEEVQQGRRVHKAAIPAVHYPLKYVDKGSNFCHIQASRALNINYSSAKAILASHRKTITRTQNQPQLGRQADYRTLHHL